MSKSSNDVPFNTLVSTPTSPQLTRLRLDFLDGIRGLAALYVVLAHVTAELVHEVQQGRLPKMAELLLRPLNFGHYAVSVFIVLSGFSLMLPVARSATRDLRDGAKNYLLRRVRRIIPPYYAALTFVLLLFVIFPVLSKAGGTSWDNVLPITAGGILSHFLLIHNLSPAWVYKISGPLWSVPTEWQIYFAFPFLLLPIWRRFGNLAVILTAFIVSLIPHFLLTRTPYSITQACPWYLGLFAVGMAGAVVGFSKEYANRIIMVRQLSARLSVALTAIFVIVLWTRPAWADRHWMPLDIIVGVAATSLIVYCGQLKQPLTPRPILSSLLINFLTAKPIVALGAFSYSLYLTHEPILVLLHRMSEACHWSSTFSVLFLFAVGVPVVMTFGYLFHLAFERPFMPGHPRTKEQAASAAAISPAP